MPTVRIETNIPASTVPEGFIEELSALASKLIGKPEKWICIIICADTPMSLGGSREPCAFVNVSSIGKISPEENQKYTEGFTPLISEKLKIPADRFYLQYYCQDANDVGWNGQTFAQRMRSSS
ncbi:macrophage migration inhibitory factor-like [Sycon ciliatum]|uniref:macrophage migration inhibitory factor-like n=1 Tax=Sycon ciliatum TaxID=27933 RepID=UPI0020AB7675|eukprot:scpid99564/ scgid23898/ Macrophage migration inhibitory factor; Glycosylation-inhibiting factor; L-dopachrome isomerase; L-dopachrome tautomerase; Phenylpyruvate tautomerase